MKPIKEKKNKCKHFWQPYSGFQNTFDTEHYPGAWGVDKVYCAYCLKVKEETI